MSWFSGLFTRGDATPPGEPGVRSVSFSTNGLRVEHQGPDVIEWVDLWGDRAVATLERPVDWPDAAFGAAALRDHYRQVAAQREGGIVSVDVIRVAGLPVARVIMKIDARPTYVYEGFLVVPLKHARFTLTLHTRERSTTGLREAHTSGFLLSTGWLPIPSGPKGPDGGVRLERWFFDPYDAAYDHQANCSVADDERLDELFVDHPLSKLRRWLRTVEHSMKIDDEVRPAIGEGWAPSDLRTRVEEQVPTGKIGILYVMRGKTDGAEALAARWIPMERDRASETGPDAADLLQFLGLAREMRGEFDEAADAFDRSRRIYQASVGDQDIRTARAASNLGRMRVVRGRLEEAEALLRGALALFTEQQSDSDAGVAANDLGLVCQQRHDHRAAVPWFEMANTCFERHERANGRPIPDRARVLNNLGKSFDELGDRTGASEARARARAVGTPNPR